MKMDIKFWRTLFYMYRARIIPVLLLRDKGLIKTVKFKEAKYIGDPINAVRIFNDLHADELVFLDIDASKQNRNIDIEFVQQVSKEANMPFSIGGGIKDIETIRKYINAGSEKVIINSEAFFNPKLITEAVKEFGSSTIVVSMDVNKTFFGKQKVFVRSGKYNTKIDPVSYAQQIDNLGVGEIIVNSIYNDGMLNGYDFNLIKEISQKVSVPVVALGGARDLYDFSKAINNSYASAVAAGSMFVFHGARKAVLINYPTKKEVKKLFTSIKDTI